MDSVQPESFIDDIREMAAIADRLAQKMNRRFVLDERKVQAYQDHNAARKPRLSK